METKPTTQAEHFARYGNFSHLLPSPTKEEALAMAMAQIERAFGKKN
jgi:hypothetical protein